MAEALGFLDHAKGAFLSDTSKRRKRSLGVRGTLEYKLDVAAWVVLLLGLLSAMLVLAETEGRALFASLWFVAIGILSWLLVRGIAEIIRLLKFQAGLPFDGAITGAGESVAWECSECGAPISDPHQCTRCGRLFVGTDEQLRS